ncbi:hypothetical protein [Streptomyces sp. NPDC037389]
MMARRPRAHASEDGLVRDYLQAEHEAAHEEFSRDVMKGDI